MSIFFFFLIEGDAHHSLLWEKAKDRYFLNILNVALNEIPRTSKPFASMTEKEIDTWLKESEKREKSNVKEYNLNVPNIERELPFQGKSEFLLLPLSLENNATVTGTASILEQFGSEFGIPCEHADRYFAFDKEKKIYDINAARKHYEFMLMLFNHRDSMSNLEEQLRSMEKTLEESNSDRELESCEDVSETLPSETLANRNKLFQNQDGKFKKIYDKINSQVINAMQSKESGLLDKLITDLNNKRETWETACDHFGRTVLHTAVENGNMTLTKTLLSIGVNVNAQEGCGATPLSLAVLTANKVMCELLVDSFASISGHLFSGMPSPIEMAQAMEVEEICRVLRKNTDDSYIEKLINFGSGVEINNLPPVNEDDNTNQDKDTNQFTYQRHIHVQFPTAIVGDQGTCKVTRSTKNRSQEAFKWVAEIPGDLHTKGYLCEAAYKALKTGC